MKMPRNLGTILLCIWLILFGLLTAPFITLNFQYSAHVLSILPIAAAVCLLFQRSA
jgi:hypothetical protein